MIQRPTFLLHYSRKDPHPSFRYHLHFRSTSTVVSFWPMPWWCHHSLQHWQASQYPEYSAMKWGHHLSIPTHHVRTGQGCNSHMSVCTNPPSSPMIQNKWLVLSSSMWLVLSSSKWYAEFGNPGLFQQTVALYREQLEYILMTVIGSLPRGYHLEWVSDISWKGGRSSFTPSTNPSPFVCTKYLNLGQADTSNPSITFRSSSLTLNMFKYEQHEADTLSRDRMSWWRLVRLMFPKSKLTTWLLPVST